MTNPYTPEKVTEEITTAQKAVWAEIHGQDATRRYSVAEVKQLVYLLDNALSSAMTALTAVSAERDAEHKRAEEARFAAGVVGSVSHETLGALQDAQAENAELRAVITEALDWRDEAYHGAFGKDDYAQGYGYARRAIGRILRAALDKEGEVKR